MIQALPWNKSVRENIILERGYIVPWDCWFSSPLAEKMARSPTAQTVKVDVVGCLVSRRGWSLPLMRTPTRQGIELCTSALSVNYIFHKSPVPTFHFWIAGFSLRTKTISLWYNRLYFYINVSSCCEIYCLTGPIRLLRFNSVFSVSQSIRAWSSFLEQLVPVCHCTEHQLLMGWVQMDSSGSANLGAGGCSVSETLGRKASGLQPAFCQRLPQECLDSLVTLQLPRNHVSLPCPRIDTDMLVPSLFLTSPSNVCINFNLSPLFKLCPW